MKDTIEIYVEKVLVSKNLEDIHFWLTLALIEHYNFKIKVIKGDKNERR